MRVLDEGDDGGVHELKAKVAMQDALTRHWQFYAKRHRDEHDGYYRSCMERRSMRSFDKTQSAAADERGAKASFFYIEVCRGSGIVKSRHDGFPPADSCV